MNQVENSRTDVQGFEVQEMSVCGRNVHTILPPLWGVRGRENKRPHQRSKLEGLADRRCQPKDLFPSEGRLRTIGKVKAKTDDPIRLEFHERKVWLDLNSVSLSCLFCAPFSAHHHI